MTANASKQSRRPSGTAGASARAQVERRRKPAGFMAVLRGDPQTTRAWDRGARGEERVGRRLDTLADRGVIVLHDRQIPGTRANLDHIAIAPTGVWIIDTKNYRGKVERRAVGRWRRREPRLFVAGRDRTVLIDSAIRQAEYVSRAICDPTMAVIPVLCFTGSEWSFLAEPFQIRGVTVCWPRVLARTLQHQGSVSTIQREALADRLAERLPSATSG